MRRNKGLATYGRHRSRVIVADAWSSEEKKRNVFSTSSELDSSKQSSIFHSSGSEDGSLSIHSDSSGVFMSSKSRKTNNRLNKENGKKTDNKENVFQQSTINRRKTKKTENIKLPVFNISESGSDSSVDKSSKPKALRERKKNIEYNDSANLKKQLRGTTAKRKRAVKTTTVAIPKNMSLNFSDFDDYSLVISDSSVNKLKNDKDSIETSTPVAKRTRHKNDAFENIKESDLSHIEIIESPTSDVCYSAMETPYSIRVGDNLASPSLVSSVACSTHQTSDRSNMCNSASAKHTPENAIVKLDRLTDSFIQTHSSSSHRQRSVYNTRNSGREVIDLSASLFSSPSSKQKSSVNLLTEMLQNISLRRRQEMTGGSDDDDSEDDSEDVVEESGDEESEGTDEDDDDEEVGDNNLDLSDIEEVDDESESEQSSSFEASDTCGSNLEESWERDSKLSADEYSGVDKRAVVNLQRLSESLISNHVSSREGRRRNRHRGHSVELNEEEDENSVDLMSSRPSDSSNSTLYMLADSNYRSSRSTCSSQNPSDTSGNNSDINASLESDYHTAKSSQVSEDDASNETHSEEEPMDSQKPKTPRKITLRNRTVENLQNSFSEMLTPTRKSRSLVPLSAHTKVLLLCEQSQAISFSEALPGRMLSQCKKIGEGVYGEVFRSCRDGQSVAIKIIPIEGDFTVNDEPQKKYAEILPEIVIAKELSNLREDRPESTSSFCEVITVSLVHGKYPAQLLKQWDIFHKTKHSENDRPDMFPDSQLYIVFEFADCGRDLESYQFDSMEQARSVLAQVTFALAVAEHSLQFEHRDLHWGNILIRPTDEEEICFKLMGKMFRIPTMGVEANVIDFTLSRLQKEGVTVFSDLSTDESMFQGEGDIQFQVYRDMKEENGNNWEPFHPFTNVLWLHYVADKLIYNKKYPSQSTRQGREILRQFRQFLSGILESESACELAIGASFLNS